MSDWNLNSELNTFASLYKLFDTFFEFYLKTVKGFGILLLMMSDWNFNSELVTSVVCSIGCQTLER